MQLRPDLIAHNHGLTYVEPLLSFARQSYSPRALRTTIAAFHDADLAMYQQAGFRPLQQFSNTLTGVPLVVLVRD